ncbi:MAG: gliding motility-associated C-terminal domain-containing protein [Bacteroidetes bacterium]|nr:gliding motility-associated C-terminal domain-containing protein [Bacteroidota bacterium]
MVVRFVYKAYLVVVAMIIFGGYQTAFAQAPNILYATPQSYTTGASITPLIPTNKGGNVPASTYGLVTTFAGNSKNGAANGQGPGESFHLPVGITIDKAGNLYVTDGDNASILKVDKSGTVTKMALSFAAQPAGFNPYGLAVDNSGNLYAPDPFANLVWKIDPSGNVTVFADRNSVTADGTTAIFSSPSGIAIDNSGNLYVANTGNGSILKITSGGTITTIATGLNHPLGLVAGTQGNVYEVDEDGNKVNKISSGNVVSTFASGAAAGFNWPEFITMDQAGNLYVTDSGNNEIKKITPAGTVTVIAGNPAGGANGGVGAAAGFNNPLGIVADAAGDLFVVDSNNNLIREISLSGYTIDKPLPPGLTFDSGTGTISGTPTSSYPSTDYTITAYNSSGGSQFTINITVHNAPIVLNPPKITYTTPDVYTVNNPIPPLSPVNTGGVVSQETYGSTTFVGSTGTSSTFGIINSIRSAGNGNLYITDGSHRLMTITPGGLLTVIAGSANASGYVDGQGSAARFNNPGEMAIDGAGNIYIADEGNNVIRKVTPGGLVTTYAGTGVPGSADGSLTTATFDHPTGLVFDTFGNLYVSDFNTDIIRKITPGGVVSTLAGTANLTGPIDGTGAAARFNGPGYLILDPSGNICVADFNNNMIRRVTPAGVVTTIAGTGIAGLTNGNAPVATFNGPQGMVFDPEGNLYVADQNNYAVRKITPAGIVSTFAGTGTQGNSNGYPLTSIGLAYPRDIIIDASGDFFLADASQVRKLDPSGYTIDKPLPAGLSFDNTTGTISGIPTVVTPPTNYTITAYNSSGSDSYVINLTIKASPIQAPLIRYFTPQVYTVNTTITPLAPTNSGGPVPANIYGQINTFAGSGTAGKTDATGRAASFSGPVGLVFDGAGNLYVGDSGNNLLRKITPAGAVTTVPNYRGNAFGITMDAPGNIYIADAANNQVEKISAAGTVSVLAGNPAAGAVNATGIAASFNHPVAVALDASGNIYVADKFNNLIREITPAGVVSTFAGSGAQAEADGTGTAASFNHPAGIAIDDSGNIYVSDAGGNTIRKISPSSMVSTLAGNGSRGSADGIGGGATFNGPQGLAFDLTGNLYVADAGNNMVRKISPLGQVTTIAGNFPGANPDNSNLLDPVAVAIDASGNAYVSEFNGNLISQIVLSGYFIDKPLPPGLAFDRKTGIISGTPTALSPATDYTITAYNMGGSSSYVLNITVQDIQQQTITFNPLPEKTYGDPDFVPGATSNNVTLPITYTSQNPNVATIVNGQIHITGAGTSNITASQPGNSQYADATPVTQQLIVDRAPLLISGPDITRLAGQPNPEFIPAYTGFAYDETPLVLNTLPTLNCIATVNSAPGQYAITVSGGTSRNYVISHQDGTLTVLPGEAAIVVPNLFTPNGDGVNDYWNIKELSFFPQCLVSVYSRSGSLVFQSHGYPRPWDGTYNGSPLPAGTYYYVIAPQSDLPKLSGYVVILR